ncbi:MAG: clan AA aspartic protease [bacterium]|nr:clan AA aspartic protease [bacterium]
MMGEVKVRVEFTNIFDEYLKKPDVRQLELDCLVDIGAVLCYLPAEVVELLGIPGDDNVIVTYADERKVEVKKVGPVKIKIGNRSGNFDCLVGPPNCEPLIGQIVLEELDYLVDPGEKELVVRPESPFLPLLKVK